MLDLELLLLLLHYSSMCSGNNRIYICIKMQTPLLVFLHCGGAKTGHKQTGTCLCLRCNSECVVFSKVVQVQLIPERESRMRRTKQLSCPLQAVKSHERGSIFFSSFFFSIRWHSVLVTIVMCSKPEGTFHSCYQVVKDIEGGLSLRPSAHPHFLQEHCLPGHSRAGC